MQKREIAFKGTTLRSAPEGDGHTIEGLAVPFDHVINFWGMSETFDRDCQFDDTDTAKLCYQHGELIGSITSAESRDDGLHITAHIADTATGRDVVALLNEGALDSLSVGFIPVDDEMDREGVTHRKRVRLLETSLVSWPAYEAAKLTDHRSQEPPQPQPTEGNPMPNEPDTEARFAALEEQNRGIMTELAKLPHSQPASPILGNEFSSAADYLRSLSKGEERAAGLMLAARDLITTGDSGNTTTWIADLIRLVDSRRKIAGILTHNSLPDKGMTLSYNAIATDTMSVDKQSKEGDKLPFGKITFGSESVNIDTYGGYTELSRTVIERSTTPMLNTAIKSLTLEYARRSELALREYLYSEIATGRDASTNANKIDAAKSVSAMEPYDWADLIIDASEALDARGASMTRLGVSSDVMKALIRLQTTGDRFIDISGQGVDTLGTIDVTGITGSLMRVPVQVLPGAPAGTAAFIDPESITYWEAGGPTQLSSEDVTTLTNAYSVYGYMAIGTTFVNGLLPIKFTDSAPATEGEGA